MFDMYRLVTGINIVVVVINVVIILGIQREE